MKFCSLQSGSTGNVQYIEYKDTKILVDCGLNGKQTASRLAMIGVNIDDIDAILITHEHADHICGAGVISRRHDIPIYATAKTHGAAATTIKDIGKHNRRFIEGEFTIKDLFIKPFATSHDAIDPIGFAIYGNKKISIITDTGFVSEEAFEATKGSTLFFVEANHDLNMLEYGPYPLHLKRRIASTEGHLSNVACAEFLIKNIDKKTKQIVLCHLSHDNNNEVLALMTVKNMLTDAGIDLPICISHRDAIGELIEL